MTPWEFHRALIARTWPAIEPVTTVTRAFCAVRYGNQLLTREEWRKVDEALIALKTARPGRSLKESGDSGLSAPPDA